MEPGLPEELLLLALHDTKGSVVRAAAPVLNGALVGAVMMELSLRGRLSEGTGRQLIADSAPTGDAILDDVCQRIAEADRQQDAAAWVSQLAKEYPDLKDRLLDKMVAAGVLEQRHHGLLWVFPSRRYPQVDGAVEQQARDRIRAIVLDGEPPDERMAALLSLVQACNLLDEIFTPDERPRARQRIVELIAGKPAEGGTFATGLGAGALFGLVGATLYGAYRKLSWSFGSFGSYTPSYWDADVLEPWLDVAVDSISMSSTSDDTWPNTAWDDRSTADATATAGSSSDAAGSTGGWFSNPWADDSGSSRGQSEDGSSSSGWSWWWSGSSDSSNDTSSNDNSSNDNSDSSWWGSSSSDSSSSDSGSSWDSGSSSSDSGSWDSSSSSC
jgi:hypothetical protein